MSWLTDGEVLATKHQLRIHAFFALAVTLVLGCRSGSDPESLCSGGGGVSAAVGTDVVFDWADCDVRALVVSDVFGRNVWSLTGTFGPPVTYGVAPASSTVTLAAEMLEVGSTYSVTISAGMFYAATNFVR